MLAKKLQPTWYSESIYKIDTNTFKENGIKNLFFDLDNTLVPFFYKLPDQKVIDFVRDLEAKGFNVIVTSNNTKNRVSTFAEPLGVKYLNSAGKPGIKRIKRYMNENNCSLEDTCIIGDQILTDIITAKRLKIKSILLKPACGKDLIKTKINRFIDNRIRRQMFKKNLLNKMEG